MLAKMENGQREDVSEMCKNKSPLCPACQSRGLLPGGSKGGIGMAVVGCILLRYSDCASQQEGVRHGCYHSALGKHSSAYCNRRGL